MEKTAQNTDTMDRRYTTLSQFAEAVKERLAESCGPGYEISVTEVTKNNDVKMTGIRIADKEHGGETVPVLYLEGYYDAYEDGADIGQLCERISERYEAERQRVCIDMPAFFQAVDDFDEIKKILRYRLINTGMNKETLKGMPHRGFLDLSIVYYIPVKVHPEGIGATIATISSAMMERWGVDEEELFRCAEANTSNSHTLHTLSELLLDALGTQDDDSQYPEIQPIIYAATSQSFSHGATAMLDKALLKEAAEKIGGDFYIIPSSLHEIILSDISIGDAESLDMMVRQVNGSSLDPTEVLADHVYLYHADTGEIDIPV